MVPMPQIQLRKSFMNAEGKTFTTTIEAEWLTAGYANATCISGCLSSRFVHKIELLEPFVKSYHLRVELVFRYIDF